VLGRTHVQWNDVKEVLTDPGIWGHLFITAIGLTPTTPLQTCAYTVNSEPPYCNLGPDLPTVIKSFNFNVYVSNALTAPPYVLTCITSVLMTYHSDRTGERGLHGAFGGQSSDSTGHYILTIKLQPLGTWLGSSSYALFLQRRLAE
jgi:hypothetical protein